MTANDERLAEALTVLKMHGERAEVHIAERIGASARAGDVAGIERWRSIAAVLDDILRPPDAC